MEGAPYLLDSFIWNSLHVRWAGCFKCLATHHEGWPRCSGWLGRCSLSPCMWSLGKDNLESKDLEVCALQDVAMVDTSALVQLASISLEWRWWIRMWWECHQPLGSSASLCKPHNLLALKVPAALGKDSAKVSALLHLAVTNYGNVNKLTFWFIPQSFELLLMWVYPMNFMNFDESSSGPGHDWIKGPNCASYHRDIMPQNFLPLWAASSLNHSWYTSC